MIVKIIGDDLPETMEQQNPGVRWDVAPVLLSTTFFERQEKMREQMWYIVRHLEQQRP
jgi:hypothetical protein